MRFVSPKAKALALAAWGAACSSRVAGPGDGATLAVSPPAAAVQAGSPAVSFTAVLSGSAAPVGWTLVGPGDLAPAAGATTSYTPPPSVAAETFATVVAAAGALRAEARVTIHPGPLPGSNHKIRVGPGFTDVSPHQLVRDRAGYLYTVAPTCASYPSCPGNGVKVFRANAPGLPSTFAELDGAHAPGGGIGSTAVAIDGSDRIHVLWNDRSPAVRYAVFDTASAAWAAPETIEQTGWGDFGQGDEGVALALDAQGTPHAVWNVKQGNVLHLRYARRTPSGWTAPVGVDDVNDCNPPSAACGAQHPAVAFEADGTLLVAWLNGTANYAPDGVVRVRARSPGGTWGPSVAIPDGAMTAIDNGPSLIVTPDGVRHLTFCNTNVEIRYWYDAGSGWRGDRQPPVQQTHDPSLGPDGTASGVFIYGHGTPQGGLAGHGDDMWFFHRPAGGPWSSWTRYATGSVDSSVSTRWSQFFFFHPATVDIAYWSDAFPNELYAGVN